MRQLLGLAALMAIAGLCVAGSAQAQDKAQSANSEPARVLLETLPEHLMRQVDKQQRQLSAAGIGEPETTKKGVFNITTLWGPGYGELRVCFFGTAGTKDMRSKIAKIANEWNASIPGLRLNFGSLSNPDVCPTSSDTEQYQIRVAFTNQGSWSLVGTQSVTFAGANEASMSLDLAVTQRKASDPELRHTVLHEFGHAFGLEHEHQHPFQLCDREYNWNDIYQMLAKPPNEMDKEQVNDQMKRLGKQGLMTSDFDRRSVMLYAYPPAYFINGTQSGCYSPRNTALSDGDKELLAKVYPSDPDARAGFVVAMKQHHSATVRANVKVPEEERTKSLGLIEGFTRMPSASSTGNKAKATK